MNVTVAWENESCSLRWAERSFKRKELLLVMACYRLCTGDCVWFCMEYEPWVFVRLVWINCWHDIAIKDSQVGAEVQFWYHLIFFGKILNQGVWPFCLAYVTLQFLKYACWMFYCHFCNYDIKLDKSMNQVNKRMTFK